MDFESVKIIVDSGIIRAIMTQIVSYSFNIFSGLRLCEIQKIEDLNDFFGVPGDMNIAAIVSR